MKTILTAFLLALCTVIQGAEAKPKAKMARIGFFAPQSRSLSLFEAFRQGLAEHGYVEGRNITPEPRFAEGQFDRFPDLFAELVLLKVDVIAVTGAVTARQRKRR